ncbi:hypothetical protein [Pseudolabrys sp. FHR47]|uniref:hypothetical protein n=1 Tax=Pseudolabrys sp. FHR47 TaxID=2562284 RepID=UPI0010BEE5BC|nr:hypothetical protein [Pseudolabrys sp. FHR47]
MRGTSHLRRLLAVAAAYVVALQLVLLPLTLAAADPLSGPLCSQAAASAAVPADPLKTNTGCACAAGCGTQCCASSALAAPSFTHAVDRNPLWTVTPTLVFGSATLAQARSPHNPRAPPAA